MSCKQPLFLEDGKLSGANSHTVTLEGDRRPSFVLVTSGGPGTLGARQMEEAEQRGGGTREGERMDSGGSRPRAPNWTSERLIGSYQGFSRDVMVSEAGWERPGLSDLVSGREPPATEAMRIPCSPRAPCQTGYLRGRPTKDNASSSLQLGPFPSWPFLEREGKQSSLTIYTQVFAPTSLGF